MVEALYLFEVVEMEKVLLRVLKNCVRGVPKVRFLFHVNEAVGVVRMVTAMVMETVLKYCLIFWIAYDKDSVEVEKDVCRLALTAVMKKVSGIVYYLKWG